MAIPDTDLTNENLSPEDAYALYQKLEAGEDVSTPVTDPEAKPDAETPAAVTEEVKGPEQAQSDAKDKEQAADGIESKNGKHILPFTVLTGEREQRQAAQRERDIANEKLQQAQAELEQLRASKNSNPGEADTERANELMDKAGDLTDAELQELKEDFPTVYKAVAKLQGLGQNIQQQIADKVDPMQQAYASAQERQVAQHREAVQEAIDSVPKLVHIQANDPAMFAVAQQCDALLMQQPGWANKPMAERFAKAVEMAESTTGKSIEIGSTQAGAADLKAAAVAKAKEQVAAMPTSLQQFPAGSAPKETALDEVRELSPAQLQQKWSGMTPAELDAELAKLV